MPDASRVDDPRLTGPAQALPRAGLAFAAVILLTGVAAGLSGMLLALLLHLVQHLAYGYSLDAVVSPESFLQGVTAASPPRRIAALTVCGSVAGVGWWAVHRFGRPLVGVTAAVGQADSPGRPMPPFPTIAHAVLQIVTVALGSPLGREVAPREMGAFLAGRLSSWAGFSPDDARLLVACGAGAGLAAVYNVPLGGALFVIEVLLGTAGPKAVVSALAASVVAATVAWIGLGNVAQYMVPPLEISPSLVAGSLVVGPVLGVAAYVYRQVLQRAGARAARGWRRVPWCLAVFAAIGVLATLFPQLPGNGKGPSQLGFDGDLGLRLAVSLLILKAVAIAATIRAGAAGGVLTPSLTVGALLACTLGHVWNLFCPGVPLPAFALVGAAAFLAAAMSMPLTAVVLTIEFTRVGHDLWVPICLAVAGSVAALHACAALRQNFPGGPSTVERRRWPRVEIWLARLAGRRRA